MPMPLTAQATKAPSAAPLAQSQQGQLSLERVERGDGDLRPSHCDRQPDGVASAKKAPAKPKPSVTPTATPSTASATPSPSTPQPDSGAEFDRHGCLRPDARRAAGKCHPEGDEPAGLVRGHPRGARRPGHGREHHLHGLLDAEQGRRPGRREQPDQREREGLRRVEHPERRQRVVPALAIRRWRTASPRSPRTCRIRITREIKGDLQAGIGLGRSNSTLASQLSEYSGGGYTTIPDSWGSSQGQPET